ncbi:hypothetical protein [Actinomadura fibrosa]|uniref:Lipoprotein n=1 Tax=Actinomadura fibrosa TaxID=111802 RepID=A0ABW2XFH2_9ACTN|nr:hypothetical protein [Actinomadura fibrosa]
MNERSMNGARRFGAGRRVVAGMALASAVAVAAGGCGSGGGEEKDGPEVAWAGKVCGAMNTGGNLSVPKIDNADVLKSRASIVKLLDDISQRMRKLETGLQGVGAPPVANGKALYTTAMGNLTRTHSTVTTASKSLHRAKVTDQKSFQRAVGRVGQAFGQFNTYQGPQQDFRKDPALNAAFEKAPACQATKA